MLTKVVYINTTAMTNFKYLPPAFEITLHGKPARVVLIDSPTYTIEGSKVIRNFDLVLESNRGTDLQHFDNLLPPATLFINPRDNKVTMAVVLNRLVTETNSLIVPKVFCAEPNKSIQPYAMGYGFNGPCVLKSRDGARGAGQIKFDSNVLPIHRLLEALLEGYHSSAEREGIIRALPSVTYNTDGENHAQEGIEMLQTQGMYVQEYIPDVIAEYRLIKTIDNKIYVCDRSHYGTDFRQATAVKDTYDATSRLFGNEIETVFDNDNFYDQGTHRANRGKFLKDIKAVVESLPILFGSVDLFFTEKGWGIFEYSNQFGAAAFHQSGVMELHRRQIEILLNYQPAEN